uniref:oxaloacetate tautomerase n=2 Tax=Macrostomum lignano TaxID=282301 RepID=A0A1I8H8P3_9PLAT
YLQASIVRSCRKIIAVGRNYAEHAAELGNRVPTEPVIFMKPASSLLLEGSGPIRLPPNADEIHHEVELAVVIGKRLSGTAVTDEEAMAAVAGYTLALDMTDRKMQDRLKSGGLPWTLAKCFDTSCPISAMDPPITPDAIGPDTRLWLRVNDQDRQSGQLKQMLFPVPRLLAFVARSAISMEPGDILLTGTPAGVGPVRSGDVIRAGIDRLLEMTFSVA